MKKIRDKPHKNNQKGTHRIWAIKNPLKSSNTRAINSMKNWRPTAKIPCRNILRISQIQEQFLRKRKFKQTAHKKHYSWWNQENPNIMHHRKFQKIWSVIKNPKNYQKNKIISPTKNQSPHACRKNCYHSHHENIRQNYTIQPSPLNWKFFGCFPFIKNQYKPQNSDNSQ